MLETLATALFWIALGKIIWLNIILSGDNAVVIAMAARGLPDRLRTRAVVFGSAAAIAMRVGLTLFAVQLLHFPYLKIAGAVLLFWIGIQLLQPESDGESIDQNNRLWAAIKTILIADLAMSVDNVIAVAAAAQSGPDNAQWLLLVLGLGLSIPLIIFGSQMLMRTMERFPMLVTLGAALLGFVAVEMLIHDPAVAGLFDGTSEALQTGLELAGAALVVLAGTWLARRGAREDGAEAPRR